jgi:hypothetical protein
MPIIKIKNVIFFKRLARNNDNTLILTSYIKPANKGNQNAIEAIAKCSKNHTIAENLIFPCIKNTVHYIWRRERKKDNKYSSFK